MPTTTNYNINLPTVGGDSDTWGTELNDAIEAVDVQMKVNADGLADKLNKSGGTLTGALNGTGGTFTGTVTANKFTGPLTGAVTGNASTATAWATGRTITLTGLVTGVSGAFDGSDNLSFATTIADAALSIAKTDGLQAALDAKEPTLDANQKREITYGTAAPSGTPSDGDIYLKYSA